MHGLSTQERERLDAQGFIALEGVVDPRSLAAMRARLEQLLEVTEQSHAGTLIVNGLLSEAVFDAAWNHPRVLAAVMHVLGDACRLTEVSSRGLRPGHGQQALHADWGGQGVPDVWYACHAICALVDFTRENGATRAVPGSHRAPWMLKGHTDPRKPHPRERQLTGAAGTVFVLNIHCAHSAVHNASKEPRLAIFSNFTRRDSPLLWANPIPEPSADILARFPTDVRRLLAADTPKE
jgi:ectoine hydroxylase-related dioxygenase (phytanoyl-CoA dioxygenase family)